MQDALVLLLTSSMPLGLVVLTEALKATGTLSSSTTRKFLHITTGLLFLLTWPLYSNDRHARFLAACQPGLMALRFVLAGLGITSEQRLVAGTARTGQRQELLAGPAMYGVAHTLLALCCWRRPAAVAGIAALCAGDGLAEVAGRAWSSTGRTTGRLPYNQSKTWAGSIACLAATFATTAAYLILFDWLGCLNTAAAAAAAGSSGHLVHGSILQASAAVAVTAALVESLPVLQAVDNLAVPAAAGAAAQWLLG